jgi:putative endonuclease
MMDSRQDLGRLGEDAAAKYLRRRGYRLIKQNHREKWGELDLITIAPDKTLVFIEVKTVSGFFPKVEAEDQMSKQKMEKFKRSAEVYANAHQKLISDTAG